MPYHLLQTSWMLAFTRNEELEDYERKKREREISNRYTKVVMENVCILTYITHIFMWQKYFGVFFLSTFFLKFQLKYEFIYSFLEFYV